MTDEEIAILIEYHAKVLGRWAGDKTSTKDYLRFHATRVQELINQLSTDRDEDNT